MSRTDTQLYFTIAVPSFTVLIGFIATVIQVNTINARFTSLETRLETLIGKVIDIDNRLIRMEERLERR